MIPKLDDCSLLIIIIIITSCTGLFGQRSSGITPIHRSILFFEMFRFYQYYWEDIFGNLQKYRATGKPICDWANPVVPSRWSIESDGEVNDVVDDDYLTERKSYM